MKQSMHGERERSRELAVQVKDDSLSLRESLASAEEKLDVQRSQLACDGGSGWLTEGGLYMY